MSITWCVALRNSENVKLSCAIDRHEDDLIEKTYKLQASAIRLEPRSQSAQCVRRGMDGVGASGHSTMHQHEQPCLHLCVGKKGGVE
eukprot:3697079-Amphidinium_carterae.1